VGAVEALLSANADPEESTKSGDTPLYLACRGNHLAVVHLLLGELGGFARVDHSNYAGATPLLAAAGCGHTECVKALLEAGASVDHADDQGWTALFAAVLQGHEDVAELLLEHGADVNQVRKNYIALPYLKGREILFVRC